MSTTLDERLLAVMRRAREIDGPRGLHGWRGLYAFVAYGPEHAVREALGRLVEQGLAEQVVMSGHWAWRAT